jgi:nucleoside-diphosphate kinase
MAAKVGEDRYVVTVEWYDNQAQINRHYRLTYYPGDKTIEMYDTKNSRGFLKRIETKEVTMGDLYIGSMITVNARRLKIIDYNDVYTKDKLDNIG